MNGISNKKRKNILRNYPERSIEELSEDLDLKPRDVISVLREAGIEVEQALPGVGVRLKSTRVNPLGIMLIVLLTMIVYTNSLQNGFHYDDIHSLLQNLAIRVDPSKDDQWLSKIVKYYHDPATFSSRPNVAMPRPLLLTTFAMNYMWTQYEPWSWILVNILLHALNGILVYLALCHLLGRPGPALLAAIFFVIHPVNTEAVNYVNCRSSLLMSTFMISTVYLFTRSLWHERKGLLVASLVCYVLGLLTKEGAFTIPALLVMIDALFIWDRDEVDWLRKRIIWYTPVVVISILYIVYRSFALGEAFAEPNRPIFDNLLTQSRALIHYINILLVPIHLNISYETIIFTKVLDNGVWAAILGLGGLVGLAFALWRKLPVVSFVIFNFFITLAPTSSVIPLNAIMNEHRPYLPSIGFSLLLALGITALYKNTHKVSGSIILPRLVRGLTVAIIACLVALTVNRNFTWETDMTVWRDSSKKSPEKAQVISDLGNAYYRTAQNVMRDFQKDKKIDIREQLTIKRVFQVEVEEGEINSAEKELLKGLYSRGVDRAAQLYRWGIRVDPYYFKAFHNLGTINYTRAMEKLKNRDKEETVKYLKLAGHWFQEALKIIPNGESNNDLGSTLMQIGQLTKDKQDKMHWYIEAEKAYRKAVSMNDELYKARTNVALTLRYQSELTKDPQKRKAMMEEGYDWLLESEAIYPYDSYTHFYKADFLFIMRRFAEAEASIMTCLSVDPKHRKCLALKRKLEARSTNSP